MRRRATRTATRRTSATCSSAASTSRRPSSRRCSSRSRTPTRTSTARWRQQVTSAATADLWAAIERDASEESSLWLAALRADPEREPVFSTLGEERFALGLETIYEGYLVHYGSPRLFAPAVADLSELISLSSQLRAEAAAGDGPLWAATAAFLGAGRLDDARAALRLHGDAAPLEAAARAAAGDGAVDAALAAHAARFPGSIDSA